MSRSSPWAEPTPWSLDVMMSRGYPVQDFDRQADLVSVDHPERRRATIAWPTASYVASQSGPISTEELRQAFVSYRALFEELLDERSTADPLTDGGGSSGPLPEQSRPRTKPYQKKGGTHHVWNEPLRDQFP